MQTDLRCFPRGEIFSTQAMCDVHNTAASERQPRGAEELIDF
jgi:hypothetical protein